MTYFRAYCLYGLCLLVCWREPATLSKRSQAAAPAHQHRDRADLLDEIRPAISFVRVKPPAARTRENICRSSDGRYLAFTTSLEMERLFYSDTRSGIVVELQGLPLAHRPFRDLYWSTRSRLVFDRWSQPHHGMHYEVDVRRQILTVAFAFPD